MALLMVCLGKPVSADFAGHGGVVRGIAVSPDGSRVMTASGLIPTFGTLGFELR
jgi:hypothetical protein